MKKVINENTIKAIVRESLKRCLKEIEDIEFDNLGDNDEGSNLDDIWNDYGNNNRFDDHGVNGVLAQSDDDDLVSRYAKSIRSSFADSKNAFDDTYGDSETPLAWTSAENKKYLSKKYSDGLNESINKAVDKAFKKVVAEIKKMK